MTSTQQERKTSRKLGKAKEGMAKKEEGLGDRIVLESQQVTEVPFNSRTNH